MVQGTPSIIVVHLVLMVVHPEHDEDVAEHRQDGKDKQQQRPEVVE